MYIEASSPRRRGDAARLWTPSLMPSAGTCLTFWYNMNGRTMGTFNIYAVANSTRPVFGNPLWTKQGNQGAAWHQEFVTLPNNLPNYNVGCQD